MPSWGALGATREPSPVRSPTLSTTPASAHESAKSEIQVSDRTLGSDISSLVIRGHHFGISSNSGIHDQYLGTVWPSLAECNSPMSAFIVSGVALSDGLVVRRHRAEIAM